MKKLIILLFAFTAFLLPAQDNETRPFIVRHSDGGLSPLVTAQIDSVTFSHYDIDSIYCQDLATQVIWTQDSIYRIPLVDIEKVQMSVPDNKTHGGVIDLSNNLLPYVIDCKNDTVLVLDGNTPRQHLPKVGDKLVYDKMTEVLPVGFIGKVLSIEHKGQHYNYICTPVSLTEIYETYFSSHQVTTDIGNNNNGSRVPPEITDRTIRLAEISGTASLAFVGHPWGCEAVSISGKAEGGVSLSPKLRVRHTRIVEGPHIIETNLMVMDVTASTSLSVGVEGSIGNKWPIGRAGANIPVAPFLRLEVEGGIAVELSGKIAASASAEQTLRFAVQTDYDNSRLIMPLRLNQFAGRLFNPVFTPEFFGEAEFKIGGYLETGLAFLTGDLAKISLFEEGGLKVTANIPFNLEHWNNSSTTTDFYNDLRDNSSLSISPYISWGWEAEALKGRLREKEEIGIKLFPSSIFERAMVPSVANPSFNYNPQGYGVYKATITDDGLFRPRHWGAHAFELVNDQEIPVYDEVRDYGDQMPHTFNTFFDIDKTKTYRIYPALEIFNHRVLAEPAIDIHTDEPDKPGTEMVECEIYSTGESRKYTHIQTGKTIQGTVLTSLTPAVKLEDYGINPADVTDCKWEWRVIHPKKDGIDLNDEYNDVSYFFDYIWYAPFYKQVEAGGNNIPPMQIYFPTDEMYDTYAVIHPNKVAEFYDNMLILRLAVELNQGDKIYPVASMKQFSYNLRQECRFYDLQVKWTGDTECEGSFKVRWNGPYPVCHALHDEGGDLNVGLVDDNGFYDDTGRTFYKNDDTYIINDWTCQKIDYTLYKFRTVGSTLFSMRKNIHKDIQKRCLTSKIGPGEGWSLYHAEFPGIEDLDAFLDSFFLHEVYLYVDIEKNSETGSIKVIDKGAHIRNR